MPNPVRPSLDAAEVLTALTALAEPGDPSRPVPDGRWALVSALALRHTRLPRAVASGEGARVVPFPGVGRGTAGAPDAVSGSVAWDSGGVPPVRSPEVEGRAGEEDGAAEVIPLPGRTGGEAGGAAVPARSGSAGRGGTIRVVPAPGAVPGLDEGRNRLTVFRSLDDGTVLGRAVPTGARLLVSRRAPAVGDVAVFATRRTLGLCPAGAPPAGGRVLGVVEAVIA
jgi:hypothetical protein